MRHLRTIPLTAAVSALVPGTMLAARPDKAPEPAENPDHINFVLINLDDAGLGDFSYTGAVNYKTPNIDRLGYGMPGNDGKPGKMVNLKVEECELYDMRRDPGERYNIISQQPDVARHLSEAADRYRRDLGDDLTGHEGTGRRKPGYR